MVLNLLLLGFLMGMKHAMEADHVAAVATQATRSQSVTDVIRQGSAWGAGHTLALFLFGSLVLWMETTVPDTLARALETAVGLMLIVLGIDVVRRLVKDRIHFHRHAHSDGIVHVHAHSHAGEVSHDPCRHQHRHARDFPIRALLVGLMHGMAGSAALILLTLHTVSTPGTGLLYIALFGLGSMLGMVALSAVMAVPLRWTAGGLTWLHNGLQGAVGVLTIALGLVLIYEVVIQGGLIVPKI